MSLVCCNITFLSSQLALSTYYITLVLFYFYHAQGKSVVKLFLHQFLYRKMDDFGMVKRKKELTKAEVIDKQVHKLKTSWHENPGPGDDTRSIGYTVGRSKSFGISTNVDLPIKALCTAFNIQFNIASSMSHEESVTIPIPEKYKACIEYEKGTGTMRYTYTAESFLFDGCSAGKSSYEEEYQTETFEIYLGNTCKIIEKLTK